VLLVKEGAKKKTYCLLSGCKWPKFGKNISPPLPPTHVIWAKKYERGHIRGKIMEEKEKMER
jgi:hypothetical protein